jgi:hypothetical protein
MDFTVTCFYYGGGFSTDGTSSFLEGMLIANKFISINATYGSNLKQLI